jgi:flagellin-like hook-associated protein FlgL
VAHNLSKAKGTEPPPLTLARNGRLSYAKGRKSYELVRQDDLDEALSTLATQNDLDKALKSLSNIDSKLSEIDNTLHSLQSTINAIKQNVASMENRVLDLKLNK